MINVNRTHVAGFLTGLLILCAFDFMATFVWLVFLTDIPLLLKVLVGSPIGSMWIALFIGAVVMWRAGHPAVRRSPVPEEPAQDESVPWHLRRYPVSSSS